MAAYGTGAIVNDGTINAESSGGALYIDPSSFTNDGEINVTNDGTLYIYSSEPGSFVNAAGATITAAAGSTLVLGNNSNSLVSNAGTITRHRRHH